MKTFAELKDNKIINVSVWDDDVIASDPYIDITGLEGVGVDWEYIDGEFVPPVFEIPDAETPVDTDQ